MEPDDPQTLYHATSRERLAGIAARGMDAGSYWTSDADMLAYYLSCVEDDGDEPVALAVRLADVLAACEAAGTSPQPDRPGLDEPITTVLGMCEEAVQEAWAACDGTWREAHAITWTLQVPVALAADVLCVDADDGAVPLTEFIGGQESVDAGH